MVRARRNRDESRAEIPGLLPRPRGAHGLCLLAGGERDDTPAARRGRRLGGAGGDRCFGRCYTIRRCREIGPVGIYGRIGPADRRTVRYDTDFEEEVRDCPLPELEAWIAREYPRSAWFREACWRNAADFRQAVYGCRSFEELARMFRCRPEEEPSIRRALVRFLAVALVVGLVIWLLARYT